MQDISDPYEFDGYGSSSGEDGYIEQNDNFVQNKATKLIELANSKVPLHLILSSYNLNIIKSYSDWSLTTTCPLPNHKNGQERTPSFGYNFRRDYFNCFGCASSGRAVEFLSYMENKSRLEVAQQILAKFSENVSIQQNDSEEIKNQLMSFAKYVREHKDDADLQKLVYWVDSHICKVPELRLRSIQSRIERVYELHNSR